MHQSFLRGQYVADLLAQSDALAALAPALRASAVSEQLVDELRDGHFARVVLTGMGSSLHALYPLHLRLSGSRIQSYWIETAELLLGFERLYSQDTLLIAVSQSGESAEIVQLLKRKSEFAHVIGLTNQAESRLARASDTTLLLHAGLESSVSCKTYVATLAALHWLGDGLEGKSGGEALADIEAAQHGLGEYLGHWRDCVEQLLPVVRDLDSVFVCGRGVSLATAGTGGLILKESTRRHAEGMSSAAFRHGPLEMAGDRVLVLVLAGHGPSVSLNRRLHDDVLALGGRAAFISADEDATSSAFRIPKVASNLLPLVEILPVQMLSLAIANRDGHQAGVFTKASKITTID